VIPVRKSESESRPTRRRAPPICHKRAATHRRGLGSTDAAGANRSAGSCKHESGHDGVGVSAAAVGVTGPCVLAVLRGCFHPRTDSHTRRPVPVIESTLTFVEVGGNPAGRRSAGRAGAVDRAEAFPVTSASFSRTVSRKRVRTSTAIDAQAFRRGRRRRRRPAPNSRTDRSQWTARAILRPVVF